MNKFSVRIAGILLMLISVSYGIEFGTVPERLSGIIEHREYNWPVILVEFTEDDDRVTTGRGRFLPDWSDVDETDTLYSYDAPPHDDVYFLSRLKGIDHYWDTVTGGKIRVKSDAAQLLGKVTLDETIRYYNPAADEDSVNYRLAEFIYESVSKFLDSGGSIAADNDGLLLYHAGVGQDFDFSQIYDETPFDLPSIYFDEPFLNEYLSKAYYDFLISRNISRGLILPEMQNQLGINIGLKGTEIVFSGFLLGMPALYNTETGESPAAGIYGLMDIGSNNAAGLAPVYPSAYERLLMGIEEPEWLSESGRKVLTPGKSYLIPVNSSEYFLIEYRKNAGVFLDSLKGAKEHDLYLETLTFYADSSDRFELLYDDVSGRLIGMNDYNISIPANGLLIWHVNDAWSALRDLGDNPNGGITPLIDLVESDGGDDIGKDYGFLSGTVNQGYKWDMWFEDNPGFRDNNPRRYQLIWNDDSYPNTRSFSDTPSGISVENFSFYADSVTVELHLDKDDQQVDETAAFWRDDVEFLGENVLLGVRDSAVVIYNGGQVTPLYTDPLMLDPAEIELLMPDDQSLYIYHPIAGSHATKPLYGLRRLTFSNSLIPAGNEILFNSNENIPANQFLAADLRDLYFVNSAYSDKYDIQSDQHESIALEGSNLKELLVADGDIYALSGSDLYRLNTSSMEALASLQNAAGFAGFNDSLIIFYEDGGFAYFDLNSENLSETIREDILFQQIIPFHLDNDGRTELAAVMEMSGKKGIMLLDDRGHVLNNWPQYGEYSQIRAAKKSADLRLFALKSDGRLDVFDEWGVTFNSYPASADAASFFLYEENDTVKAAVNGTVWSSDADKVIWGHENYDHSGTNWYRDVQAVSGVSGDELILDGLVYNYPNPITGGRSRFRYTAVNAEEVTIDIYDYSGKKVEHLSQIPVKGQVNEILWQVGDLASGVYLAKITVKGSGNSETYIIKPAILK